MSTPGRVLMVSSLWPPHVLGGAELYASELAQRLRDGGTEVGVVTLGVTGPDVVEAVRPLAYRLDDYAGQSLARRGVFHVSDLYRPATHRVLARAISSFAPDVVHTHGLIGLSTAALSTPSALGVPHVHTVHDHWLVCQRATLVRRDGTPCSTICGSCMLWSRARGVLLHRHHPSVLLVGSRDAAHEHEELVSFARGRTRVLYPPIPDLPPEASPRDGKPADGPRPPTFGYLGRLDVAKGVRTLLETFRTSAPPGARLIVAGEGPLRAEVEAAATGPAVTYAGWVSGEERETFYGSIDALVVPSECRELTGLVVLEARARRIPIVGARIGGIPEVVPEESRALLFESGDPVSLGASLALVASDQERFVGSEAGARGTWPEHLDGVRDAYARAQRSDG